MKEIRDVFSRRPKKYRVVVFRVPEKKLAKTGHGPHSS
jgi:hypothetical protein